MVALKLRTAPLEFKAAGGAFENAAKPLDTETGALCPVTKPGLIGCELGDVAPLGLKAVLLEFKAGGGAGAAFENAVKPLDTETGAMCPVKKPGLIGCELGDVAAMGLKAVLLEFKAGGAAFENAVKPLDTETGARF